MLLDPADIRFTQDSISLYFQAPYDHFSIRQAVRRISNHEMTPDEFPSIRVISYNGCLWSIDNRRLWVFRFARCRSISVRLEDDIHPRLYQIILDKGVLCLMEGADFFPRVRDRGRKDLYFDRLYPQPSSLYPSRSYDCIITVANDGADNKNYTINKAQEHAEAASFVPKVRDKDDIDREYDRLFPQLLSFQSSRSYDYITVANDGADNKNTSVTATPQTLPTSTAGEHADNKNTSGISSPETRSNNKSQVHVDSKNTSVTTSPQTPSISTAQDHRSSEITSGSVSPQTQPTCSPGEDVTSRTHFQDFLNVIWSAAKMTIGLAAIVASKTVSVAREIKNAFKPVRCSLSQGPRCWAGDN